MRTLEVDVTVHLQAAYDATVDGVCLRELYALSPAGERVRIPMACVDSKERRAIEDLCIDEEVAS